MTPERIIIVALAVLAALAVNQMIHVDRMLAAA
jgi:hypothetical protein